MPAKNRLPRPPPPPPRAARPPPPPPAPALAALAAAGSKKRGTRALVFFARWAGAYPPAGAVG
jgi:hypothetical protein